MSDNLEKLLKLKQENPDLPVLFFLSTQLDDFDSWDQYVAGYIFYTEIAKVYISDKKIHIMDKDDPFEILITLEDAYGKEKLEEKIRNFSEAEINELYQNLLWKDTIVVVMNEGLEQEA